VIPGTTFVPPIAASANGVIAYRAETIPGVPHLMRFDRQGRVLGLPGDLEASMAPAWSPDGTRLALSRSVDGNVDIYTYDIRRGISTRRTAGPETDAFPYWNQELTPRVRTRRSQPAKANEKVRSSCRRIVPARAARSS
jgi:hypothetical protein